MILRCFFLSFVYLAPLLDVTVAEGNNYEDFLPLNELNEPEWTLGNSATASNVDLFDADQLEYPFELEDQDLPQDIASADQGCSSDRTQGFDRLKPRGGDEIFCKSNLGPQDPPLVIPNLFTMNLEVLCPNKLAGLASNLVCASPISENVQISLLVGTTLLECELGEILIFSESSNASK